MDATNMMLLLAAAMSEEEIVKELKKEIAAYDEATPEEKPTALRKLQFGCSLLLSKEIAPNMDEAFQAMDKFKRHQQALEDDDAYQELLKGDGSQNKIK